MAHFYNQCRAPLVPQEKTVFGFVLSVLVLLLLGSDVSALSRRHDVSDQQYLQLAQDYPSVGRFLNGFSNGSGVLIAPQWVLMASHNVMFQTAPFAFEIGGRTYPIDWSKRHFAALPGPGAADFTFDIALAHLAHAVTHVAPAHVYGGNEEVGMVVTLVGYGLPGDGVHGVPLHGAQTYKRAGQNVIEAIGHFDGRAVTVDTSGRLLFYDFDNPASVTEARNWFDGSNTPLALESMATSGDSGGGVFAATPTGRQLIGIHSGVFPGVAAGPSHTYGMLSRNVRVSSFLPWIQATMSRFAADDEPLKGLVAHWDFDDLSDGFAHDVSGVGHRGTVVRAGPTDGILGGGLALRASPEHFRLPMTAQEYVEVPNATSAWKGVIAHDLKIPRDITIAAWVYRIRSGGEDGKALSDRDTIVAKVPLTNKNSDFAFMIWEDHLRLYGNMEHYAKSLAHTISYATWHHVAVTRLGNIVKFYVNGKFLGHDQWSNDFSVSDSPLVIGNFPEAGLNFSGKIDDLRIYNRSLTQEEVMRLADADNLKARVSSCPPCSHD